MLRFRMRLPHGKTVKYTNLDVIRDAALNMLVAAGGQTNQLIGEGGLQWAAAPICRSYSPPRHGSRTHRIAREIVLSTPDPTVAALFAKADPDAMRKDQQATGEQVDLTGASIVPDMDPVIDGATRFISAYALTPLLASRVGDRTAGRWHSDVSAFDISTTVSARLSRLAGRMVRLVLEPDQLYLAGRRTHATRVDLRTKDNKPVVLVGMTFPFTLFGPAEDLRLAWYAGLGERTRMGFGFFGTGD